MAATPVKIKWNVGTIQDGADTAIVYEFGTNLGERGFAYKTVAGNEEKWAYINRSAIQQALEGRRASISRRLDFSRFFEVSGNPQGIAPDGYLTVSNEPTAKLPRKHSVTTTYFSILGEGVDAPDLNGNGIADGLEPETETGNTETGGVTKTGFLGGLESFFTSVKDFVGKNPIVVAAVVGFLFFTKSGKKFKKSVLKTVGLGGK